MAMCLCTDGWWVVVYSVCVPVLCVCVCCVSDLHPICVVFVIAINTLVTSYMHGSWPDGCTLWPENTQGRELLDPVYFGQFLTQLMIQVCCSS